MHPGEEGTDEEGGGGGELSRGATAQEGLLMELLSVSLVYGLEVAIVRAQRQSLGTRLPRKVVWLKPDQPDRWLRPCIVQSLLGLVFSVQYLYLPSYNGCYDEKSLCLKKRNSLNLHWTRGFVWWHSQLTPPPSHTHTFPEVKGKTDPHSEDMPPSMQPGKEGTEGGGGGGEFSRGATAREGL